MGDFLKQIATNLELEWAITEMELKLHLAKKNGKEFPEQDKIIKVLRDFQFEYLSVIEENRMLTDKFYTANAKNVHLVDSAKTLKEEIERLKSNISL